ncbi:hypothetical protein SNARM312S_04668 [Streptomyces narbonensis]
MTDGKRRKSLAVAAAVVGGVLVLSACNDDNGGSASGSATPPSQSQVDEAAEAAKTSKAQITIAPKTGTQNASINNDAKVTVTEGKLTDVTMTSAEGTAVKGEIAADGLSWKPTEQLERATVYKIAATATDAAGLQAHENASFTTVSKANSFIGYFTPEDGSTVGVGMPVSINFNKAITNKAAVQKGITVTSSGGQEVAGHWFNGPRLDCRPDKYWTEGSTVTLKLDLDGVEGADGVFGVQQKTVTFKIGRNQVSTVDVATKTMTVTQDGKTIKTIPISAWLPGEPDLQRSDGDLREVQGDPDERRDRRLHRRRRQGRVRHQGRAARHAAVHVGHLHPRQLLGPGLDLRLRQHQPRLRRPERRQGRRRPEPAGRLALRPLDRR